MKDFVRSRRIGIIIALLCSYVVFAAVFTLMGGFEKVNISDGSYNLWSNHVEAPTFSHMSGFYAEPFFLEINVPEETKVYYTLDCTDPDEDSMEYTGPIYLENATQHENVFSMRTDISVGFYTDLIEKRHAYDGNPEYKVPDFPVEKCNVVRARAIAEDGSQSETITQSYFVGLKPSDFGQVNIITVTTAPENLFSKYKGIYVTGDVFERYLQEENLGRDWRYWDWRFWPANYRQKGKNWQRSASFSFFDAEGQLICELQSGAIRTQGAMSRGPVPRGLNLFANDLDNDGHVFDADFFGTGYKPYAMTLASGGNRIWTKMNDVFMTDRCSQLHFATMNYRPYVLFLDGEYWGFYWLAEKYDATFFHYYYGVDEDNVLIVKNDQVDVGNTAYLALYARMRDEIISLDMSDNSAYQHACELVDIDSFIDYYATMAYIARREDWPMSNYALWRTIEIRDDEFSDGKWRWLLFDCNSPAMYVEKVEENSIEYILNHDPLFQSFWENAGFRHSFQSRLMEIRQDCFDEQSVIEYIEHYDADMRGILEKSWTRFHGRNSNKMTIYESEMHEYKLFFSRRFAVVNSWMN